MSLSKNKLFRALIVCLAIGAVLVLGVYLVTSFGDRRDRDSVNEACGGFLRSGELTDFLESERLYASESRAGVLAEFEQTCLIQSRDSPADSVQIAIGWTDEMHNIARSMSGPRQRLYSPLGNGWSGFLASDSKYQETESVVLLECSESRSVIVQAQGRLDRAFDSVKGGELARIAAASAEQVALANECPPVPGQPISDVELPASLPSANPAPDENSLPLAGARGTCAALAGVSAEVETLGGISVMETEAGLSPLETCLIFTDDEGGEYWLSAWYGPYANESVLKRESTWDMSLSASGASSNDALSLRVWGAAECVGESEVGRFALRSGTSDSGERTYTEAEREAQRELLHAFARESAERHGCDEVELPPAAS
ncbi:hypothetical protein ACWD33_14715 [Streptomyces xiamenensis]|uniref:hypothetical protein n=1 Tax=Streptomyces xiamenensis TaxID=408015 RepID=UPI000A82779F|nr:hypothetical protein [Streptomyces xiamenensis]